MRFVTGTVGAVESSNYLVSEIEVVDTDSSSNRRALHCCQRTTVAFDFDGQEFGNDMALHLYGTPGRDSGFDFMWDILIRKVHALYLASTPAEATILE